jgi:hypothetical protein
MDRELFRFFQGAIELLIGILLGALALFISYALRKYHDHHPAGIRKDGQCAGCDFSSSKHAEKRDSRYPKDKDSSRACCSEADSNVP